MGRYIDDGSELYGYPSMSDTHCITCTAWALVDEAIAAHSMLTTNVREQHN